MRGAAALLGDFAHRSAFQYPGDIRRAPRVDQRPPDNDRLPGRELVATESRFIAAATEAFEDKPILLSVERDGVLEAVATNSLIAKNRGREEARLELEPPAQLDFLILEGDRASREIYPSRRLQAGLAWFRSFCLLFAS